MPRDQLGEYQVFVTYGAGGDQNIIDPHHAAILELLSSGCRVSIKKAGRTRAAIMPISELEFRVFAWNFATQKGAQSSRTVRTSDQSTARSQSRSGMITYLALSWAAPAKRPAAGL